VDSTAHDFLPHNWGLYAPTWVEVSITLASICWFLLCFFLFAKYLPAASIAESKEIRVSAAAEAAL
jgi:molybdopterin-containing oxidoreductase family membrane subunit